TRVACLCWGEWEKVVGLMGEWWEVAGVGESGVAGGGGKKGLGVSLGITLDGKPARSNNDIFGDFLSELSNNKRPFPLYDQQWWYQEQQLFIYIKQGSKFFSRNQGGGDEAGFVGGNGGGGGLWDEKAGG
nr:hypothetical protein [Tanacetum cinerariifolium]